MPDENTAEDRLKCFTGHPYAILLGIGYTNINTLIVKGEKGVAAPPQKKKGASLASLVNKENFSSKLIF